MATNFDRWEKDPFFSAAEEVQESADRMESTCRTWIHAKKDASSMWDAEGLRRDLHTAFSTAKWQLDEFERAVRSSYVGNSNDDARDRHRDFINAILDNIKRVENSLKESSLSGGKSPLAWVRLDEGERNELALFLLAPPLPEKDAICQSNIQKEQAHENGNGLPSVCGKILNNHFESDNLKAKNEEKSHGHRRTASANADIGAWNILIAEDGCHPNSLYEPASRTPRKVPSFSGFLNTMESTAKFKSVKNGARKWKPSDCHHESDVAPLQSVQLSRGISACYKKSKRQLQRSQYQMQYRRPVQAAIWAKRERLRQVLDPRGRGSSKGGVMIESHIGKERPNCTIYKVELPPLSAKVLIGVAGPWVGARPTIGPWLQLAHAWVSVGLWLIGGE